MSTGLRIWVQGATDRACMGPYLQRLEPHLQAIAGPGVTVAFHTTTPPVTSVHPVTEFRFARQVIRSAVEAERQGYDAFILNHFQDAGLAEAKSVVSIPVLGLGETTLLHACLLGRKLGLVTIHPMFIPWHEDQVRRYGLEQRVAGIRAVPASVAEFIEAFADPAACARLRTAFEREVEPLLEAGADVIVPAGGLPMMLFAAERGASIGGAPIVNGVAVLVKAAEMAIQLRAAAGLGVSRRANYALPPPQALQEFLQDR
jgi:allantoin racemase